MALATLSIDLVAKLASFEADLGKAARVAEKQAARIEAAFAGVKTAVAGLGIAALVSAKIDAIRNSINKLDAIDDLSEKYGIAASKLAAYSYASEVAGTSTEALATGLNKLSKNIAAAAGGSSEQVAAFKAIGVAVKDANGQLRSADDVLLDIAQRFAGYEDGAAKAALAQQLFGKSGVDMIPILNRGADGIQQLTGEAQRLGLVMGDEAYKAAGDLNDNLKKLELAAEKLNTRIAAELVPTLAKWTDELAKSLEKGSLLEALWNRMKANAELDPLAFDRKSAQEASVAVEGVVKRITQLQEALKRDADAGVPVANPAVVAALREAQAEYTRLSAAAGAANEKLKATAAAIKPVFNDYGNEGRNYPKQQTQAPVIDNKAAAQAEAAEKSYRKLIESIEERGRLARAELENNTKLDEADKFRIASLAKLNLAENHYTESMKASGRAAVERVARDLEAVESRDRIRQITEQAAAAEQAQLRAIEATSLARVDENRTLRDYIDQLGLTAEQLEQVRIKRLENQLAVEQGVIRDRQREGASAAEIIQLKEAAGLLQQQIELRQRVLAAQSALARDPYAGATQGVKDYLEQIGKAGDASRSAVSGALNTLEDDLTRSLATGKGSVSAFIDQIEGEFYRLAIVRPFLNDLFGMLGAGKAGSLFGNLLSPQGSLIGAIGSLFGFAKGGAFSGGQVVPFASGGIFDSPHLFRFANGGAMQTGVLGEAGPEAILPLRRGANGKLGVVASGGGGRSIVLSPNIQIYIDSRTDQAAVHQIANQAVQTGMTAVLQRLTNEGVRP